MVALNGLVVWLCLGAVAACHPATKGASAPADPPRATASVEPTTAERRVDSSPAVAPSSVDSAVDSRRVSSDEAVQFAQRWLDALRRRDVQTLYSLTAIPSAIRGFNLDSGPEAAACGAQPRGDGLVGVRAFDPGLGIQREIHNQTDMVEVFRCLLLDGMLVDYIPPLHDGGWPSDRGDSRDGPVGVLIAQSMDDIAREFIPYRDELLPRTASHVFVQARMVDNNGVTIHALITVPNTLPARVDGVYIHELFEC